MAVEIATAYVNIVPYARGFGRQLANALGTEVTAASKLVGGQSSSAFGSSFLPGIASVAKGAGAAIAIGMAAATTWGIKVAASNETAQISFEALLGSAEKGQKMFNDLKEFAKHTPFQFPELQQSASRMLAMGFDAEQVIPILTTLGNATTATGTGADGIRRATIALQQMKSAGRIFAQDLNQLRDAGIPVFDLLAGATGKTNEELTQMARNGELGKKELDQLFDALQSGKGLEKYNGLMAKMNDSLVGQWSNLKDELGQGLAEAFAPALPAIKDMLAQFAKIANTTLAAVGPHIATIMSQLVRLLAELMPVVAPMIAALTTVIGAVADVLAPVLQALAPVFTQVVDILAGAFTMALQGLAPVVLDLVKAFLPLAPVLARLVGTGFVIFITLLGGLVKALTPVIELVANDLGKALDDLIPMWLDLAWAMMPLFPSLVEIAKALAPLVSLMATFQTKLIAKLLPLLVPVVSKLVDMANVLAVQLVPPLKLAVGLLTSFFDAFLRGDQAKMDEIGSQIGAVIEEAKKKFGPLFASGLSILLAEFQKWWDATAWPWLQEKGLIIAKWLDDWVKEQTDKIPEVLKKTGDAIVAWMKNDLPGLMVDANTNLWLGLVEAFIDAVNGIIHIWNALKFAPIEVDGRTVFEGFSPPQIPDIPKGGDVTKRAAGGRLARNQTSLVGELGPELFVPDSAGTVVPNNQLAGGFHIDHFEVHGTDEPVKTAFTVRKELRWLSMTAGGA